MKYKGSRPLNYEKKQRAMLKTSTTEISLGIQPKKGCSNTDSVVRIVNTVKSQPCVCFCKERSFVKWFRQLILWRKRMYPLLWKERTVHNSPSFWLCLTVTWLWLNPLKTKDVGTRCCEKYELYITRPLSDSVCLTVTWLWPHLSTSLYGYPPPPLIPGWICEIPHILLDVCRSRARPLIAWLRGLASAFQAPFIPLASLGTCISGPPMQISIMGLVSYIRTVQNVFALIHCSVLYLLAALS